MPCYLQQCPGGLDSVGTCWEPWQPLSWVSSLQLAILLTHASAWVRAVTQCKSRPLSVHCYLPFLLISSHGWFQWLPCNLSTMTRGNSTRNKSGLGRERKIMVGICHLSGCETLTLKLPKAVADSEAGRGVGTHRAESCACGGLHPFPPRVCNLELLIVTFLNTFKPPLDALKNWLQMWASPNSKLHGLPFPMN